MRNHLPIDLTGPVLEGFDTVGFWTLSSLASQGRAHLNEFQERLLRAVHWFSVAQSQASSESQLLNLMTSLEALFATPSDDERISKTLAEGVAIVLHSDLDKRTEVKDFVAGVYAKLASEPIPSPFEASARPTLRSLRLRQHMSLDELADRIDVDWIDAECIELWETWRVRPSIVDLRRLSAALRVAPEDIALPKHERVIRVRGYLFHFDARRLSLGLWKAGTSSLDSQDSVAKPVRPLDPEDPTASMNPGDICSWEELGYSRTLALSSLEHRIRTAIERATEPATAGAGSS